MLRRLFFLILITSIALAGCNANSSPNKKEVELKPIRLPMGYIPNVQYAPFYVASEKGYFRQAGLEIEFDYSYETDGVALVGANEIQFSLVSGEQVLLARAQGLPVVYVLAWWQDYPVAVAALKEKGIATPADLKGKKIGLPGLFGANYIGLRALLNVAGLTEEDVTLDSIGFNQVESLMAGQQDAVSIYANNEPIQLEKNGYPVDIIRVADYVQLASNGLLTNETTIANDPELVRKMAQAILKGIVYTLDHPEEAYEICKKYVEELDQADQEVQKAILAASLGFWETDHLGYSEPESWKNMQAVLIDMGMIVQPLDLSKVYSNDFIETENK